MPNHWIDSGELVIEDRTLFRHVGWLRHNDGSFHGLDAYDAVRQAPLAGFAPIYVQIATDHGEGWED